MNADTMKGLIDGLLLALEEGQRHGVVLSPEAMQDYHAALTALVAERDALWKERDELLKENVALRDRLKAKQDEVLDREFEMDALRQQRDEARRWVCRLLANPTWATDLDKPGKGTAKCFAKEQGWDCFMEGGGA